MPFEVFRRHQRKMLAVLAILAMFTFVLADSVPRLLSPNTSGADAEVARLYGKAVRRSDLGGLARQRSRANLVVGLLNIFGSFSQEPFGGLKERDLIDAYILDKEADRLGMPNDPITGREWLRERTAGRLNRELFEQIYGRFSNEVSQETLLSDIANQVRIAKVRSLQGRPLVTPYDVFMSYRGQGERVANKAVEIPVENFMGKVGEPSEAELKDLFDKYKDVLPAPTSETPGFKVPRQVQVEFVTLDGAARAKAIRDKLTDADLQAYYENHKADFKVPSELPDDLFADAADLTPPLIQPFAEVRALLASRLADEKAQAEINDVFNKLRDDKLIPYADAYLTMLDEQQDDPNAKVVPPAEVDLKALAKEADLAYEISPLMARERAGSYGMISNAQVGTARFSEGRRFADEFFDSKLGLFEPVELTDIMGTRYLARKLKDEKPRIPAFDEAKPEVIHAWKMSKARPLAEKAAQDLAAKLKAEKKGKLEEDQIDGYNVLSIPPITQMQAGVGSNPFEMAPASESPIPDVPFPGEAFRGAYFNLHDGEAVVAPNQPATMYYVLAQDRREPVDFAQLYGPTGEEMRFRAVAGDEAERRQDEAWMARLRRQAGLPENWTPPDETPKDDVAQN